MTLARRLTMMPPMNQPAIRVGCVGFRGSHREYFDDLAVMELDDRAGVRLATYRRWREEGPPGGFIPRIASGVIEAGFQGAEAEKAWAFTEQVVERLGAEQVLMRTPASFRPTADNRQALVDFFAPRTAKIPVAWWAEGLWESQTEDFLETCEAAGLRPVIDPLAWDEDAPFPSAGAFYWRLLGRLGMGGRYSDYDFDRLLELAADREGVVIFTHARMRPDAIRLALTLAQLAELSE